MILCHSPLKTLVPDYMDKYVLFSGIGDIINVANGYGFKKAIELDELLAIHPELHPLTTKWYPESTLKQKKQDVI
jgi:hypothetical protein